MNCFLLPDSVIRKLALEKALSSSESYTISTRIMLFVSSVILAIASWVHHNNVQSFSPPQPPINTPLNYHCRQRSQHERRSSAIATILRAEPSERSNRKKRQYTLKELSQEIMKNPAKFQKPDAVTKKKSRRTRKKVDQPQQQYMYASQRKKNPESNASPAQSDDEGSASPSFDIAAQAKELGLVMASQHCDPIIGDPGPRILGKLLVSETGTSGSDAYAYLLEKPIGWSVVGARSKKKGKQDRVFKPNKEGKEKDKNKFLQQIKIVDDDDGAEEILEYNELDILALMTPEEIENYKQESGNNFAVNIQGHSSTQLSEKETPQSEPLSQTSTDALLNGEMDDLDEETAETLRRIQTRQEALQGHASFAEWSRPSLVSWLKDRKAEDGEPIRGGNFWTSFGASEVDDSGLVLLVPKSSVDNVVVDYTEYVCAVGNGENSLAKTDEKKQFLENPSIDVVAKLKRNREDDVVNIVKVHIPAMKSVCSSVVSLVQGQFKDAIRGDPLANPFDRRARRRLIHCDAMSISSTVSDDTIQFHLSVIPDDIAILSDRRNNHKFSNGSFLGRRELANNEQTNAYREINGAADGFPGWTVDRYDKWLFVQHDPNSDRGPLPSIHDGSTLGVYYLQSIPDRSAMGTANNRPILLEGKKAPEYFDIIENGVKYTVSLDQDLSTGVFLDQRPQRAWLRDHCSNQTVVLNCFAHTGAFSVAAAMAGARTVSIDLSRKWLDRLPHHFASNGLSFDERHDFIYGDCFDWLHRLAKRGEKYDIVILDPPSTSVGGKKKKRWSIRNDMDELVALASQLVKPGGLLWTTTNSASMHPIKFAKLCHKGLVTAKIEDAKLERIQPMPIDFPSIGSPQVKNLVWRMPAST